MTHQLSELAPRHFYCFRWKIKDLPKIKAIKDYFVLNKIIVAMVYNLVLSR